MLRRHSAIQLGWETGSLASNAASWQNLTLVIPTLDDADSIQAVLESLSKDFPEARLLVVDDCSVDGTQALVMQFVRNKNRKVDLLERRGSRERGLNASLLDALSRCGTRHVVVLSPRMIDPQLIVQRFLSELAAGAEFVVAGASRTVSRLPWGERAVRVIAQRVLRRRGITISDPMGFAFAAEVSKLKEALRVAEPRLAPEGSYFLFGILSAIQPNISIREIKADVSAVTWPSSGGAREKLSILRAAVGRI